MKNLSFIPSLKIKEVILLSAILLISLFSQAQISQLVGNEITTVGNVFVENDFYKVTPSFNYADHNLQNKVSLKFDNLDFATLGNNFSLTIPIEISFYNQAGVKSGITEQTELTVDWNCVGADCQALDEAVYITQNEQGYRFDVRVRTEDFDLSQLAYLSDHIILETEILVDRVFELEPTVDVYEFHDENSINNNEEIKISWNPVVGATEYEVAFYHVAEGYETDWKETFTSGDFYTEVTEKLRKQATRIVTNELEFTITSAFELGDVYYCVRPIGRKLTDPSKKFYGNFSWDLTNKININETFAANRTWSYSGVYSSESRKGESVTYVDPTGRVRQQVTKDWEHGNVLVGEQFYGYLGEPMISVAPGVVPSKKMSFYESFTLNASNEPYNKENFAKDSKLIQGGADAINAKANTATEFHNNYFSKNNPFIGDGVHDYIADAQGYNFQQTVFNQHGKVKTVSGIGPDHKLGSGHEVEISYASPNQEEIDRLFGNEVGDASHYSYAITKNQDGQKSISYYNLAGQVIATALVGTPGDNLEEITTSNYSFSTPFDRDIIESAEYKKTLEDGSQVLVNNLFVKAAGKTNFYYRLDAESFTECENASACEFDIELFIINDIGERQTLTFYGPEDANGDRPVLSDDQTEFAQVVSSNDDEIVLDFSADLKEETYFIYKKISRKLGDLQEDLDVFVADLRDPNIGCEDPDFLSYAEILESLKTSQESSCETSQEDCKEYVEELVSYYLALEASSVITNTEEERKRLFDEPEAFTPISEEGLADFENVPLIAFEDLQSNPLYTEIVNEGIQYICVELNTIDFSNPSPNQGCSGTRDRMLMDMTKGGQYYDNIADTLDPFGWLSDHMDIDDLEFYPYDENGDVSTDEDDKETFDSWEDLDDNWVAGYEEALVNAHPEISNYAWCETVEEYNAFQYKLTTITYKEAVENNEFIIDDNDPAVFTNTNVNFINDPLYDASAQTISFNRLGNTYSESINFNEFGYSIAQAYEDMITKKLEYQQELRVRAAELDPLVAAELLAKADEMLPSAPLTFTDKNTLYEEAVGRYNGFRSSFLMIWKNYFLERNYLTIKGGARGAEYSLAEITVDNSNISPTDQQQDLMDAVQNDESYHAVGGFEIRFPTYDIPSLEAHFDSMANVNNTIDPLGGECENIKTWELISIAQSGFTATLLNGVLQGALDLKLVLCKEDEVERVYSVDLNLVGAYINEHPGTSTMEAVAVELSYNLDLNVTYQNIPNPNFNHEELLFEIEGLEFGQNQYELKFIKTEANQITNGTFQGTPIFDEVFNDYYYKKLDNFVFQNEYFHFGNLINTPSIFPFSHWAKVSNGDDSEISTYHWPDKLGAKDNTTNLNRLINNTDNALLVDGRSIYNGNEEKTAVLCYEVELEAGKEFVFSFNASGLSQEEVAYQRGVSELFGSLNGEFLGSPIQLTKMDYLNAEAGSEWKEIGYVLTPAYTETGEICIHNYGSDQGNNLNFALDDIYFGKVVGKKPVAITHTDPCDPPLQSIESNCVCEKFNIAEELYTDLISAEAGSYYAEYREELLDAGVDLSDVNAFIASNTKYNFSKTEFTFYDPIRDFKETRELSKYDVLSWRNTCKLNQDTLAYNSDRAIDANPPSETNYITNYPLILEFNCEDPRAACLADHYSYLEEKASEIFEEQIEEKKAEFMENYVLGCMDGLTERFWMDYDNYEYNYTLYYYDAVGNLTATVYPEGVRILSKDEITAVQTFRTKNSDGTETDFTGATFLKEDPAGTSPHVSQHIQEQINTFEYNTLGEVIHSHSPDAGDVAYFYDELGRLVASQNAMQKVDITAYGTDGLEKYSVTTFDEFGRIHEVGEYSIPHIKALTNAIALGEDSDLSFNDWLQLGRMSDVTRTRYDKPSVNTTLIQELTDHGTGAQEFNRNRITSVEHYENGYDGFDDYTSAYFYRYNVHGLTTSHVQHNPELAQSPEAEEFKITNYDFDLFSGLVNEVAYQAGKEDQLLTKFDYDKSGRLKATYTSVDDVNWDLDAKNHYYLHGPKYRMEVGDRQIQGIDVVSTLAGLKGVNSNSLDYRHDIGKDGGNILSSTGTASNDIHSNFARDAAGFVLKYYKNDYSAIGGTTYEDFEANDDEISNHSEYLELFSGQITASSTTIRNLEVNDAAFLTPDAQYHAYKYDNAYNFIEQVVFKANDVTQLNSWQGAALEGGSKEASSYYVHVDYDLNKNIKSLKRNRKFNGTAGSELMDDFTYKYHYKQGDAALNKSDELRSNKLYHVHDLVSNPNHSSDGDYEPISSFNQGNAESATYAPTEGSMGGNIFRYNKLGQLVENKGDGLKIEWTTTGKVKTITRTAQDQQGDNLEFKYDAFGRRIVKIVKPRFEYSPQPGITLYQETDPSEWEYTYYSLDGNGVTQATYKHKFNTIGYSGGVNPTAIIRLNDYVGSTSDGQLPHIVVKVDGQTIADMPFAGNQWSDEGDEIAYYLNINLNNLGTEFTSRLRPDLCESCLEIEPDNYNSLRPYGLGVEDNYSQGKAAEVEKPFSGELSPQPIFQASESKLQEHMLYADSRLGVWQHNKTLTGAIPSTTGHTESKLGEKYYEFKNWLGSVISVFKDVKYVETVDEQIDVLTTGFEGGDESNYKSTHYCPTGYDCFTVVDPTSVNNTVIKLDPALAIAEQINNPSAPSYIVGALVDKQVQTGDHLLITAASYWVPGSKSKPGGIKYCYFDDDFQPLYFISGGVAYSQTQSPLNANQWSTIEYANLDIPALYDANGQKYHREITLRVFPRTTVNTDLTYYDDLAITLTHPENKHFMPVIVQSNDYYPYGMTMPGRGGKLETSAYRYGYQGSEINTETHNNSNQYTTQFRQLDARFGRWFSTDPVFLPHQSPYNSMDGDPINGTDVYGDCKDCKTDVGKKTSNAVADSEDANSITVFVATEAGAYKHVYDKTTGNVQISAYNPTTNEWTPIFTNVWLPPVEIVGEKTPATLVDEKRNAFLSLLEDLDVALKGVSTQNGVATVVVNDLDEEISDNGEGQKVGKGARIVTIPASVLEAFGAFSHTDPYKGGKSKTVTAKVDGVNVDFTIKKKKVFVGPQEAYPTGYTMVPTISAKSSKKTITTSSKQSLSKGKTVNGNSKKSTKAQHGYEVYDQNGNVVKTGVSGGAENKNGSSPRANKQVNTWNKDPNSNKTYSAKIVKRVPEGPGARETILNWERQNANKNRSTLDPAKHKTP